MGAPKLDYSLTEQKTPLKVVYSDLDKKFDNSPDEKITNSNLEKTVSVFDYPIYYTGSAMFNPITCAISYNSAALSHLNKLENDDILTLAEQYSNELTERLSLKGKVKAGWDKIKEEVAKANELCGGDGYFGSFATVAAIVFTPFTKFKSDKYYREQKAAKLVYSLANLAKEATEVEVEEPFSARIADLEGGRFMIENPITDSEQLHLMIECANQICLGKRVRQPKIKGPKHN